MTRIPVKGLKENLMEMAGNSYSSDVNHMMAWLNEYGYETFTPENMFEYYEYLKKEETIAVQKKRIKALRRIVLEYSETLTEKMDEYYWMKLRQNLKPIKKHKADIATKIQSIVLNQDQIFELMDNVDPRISIMIFVISVTGVRIGEMLTWKHSDVKIDGDDVRIKSVGKGGYEHEFRFKISTYNEITEIFGSGKKFLFCHGDHAYGTRWANDMFRKEGLRNGKKIYPHLFRHSCATIMDADGFKLKEISTHLTHQGIAVTADYYMHNSAEPKKIDDLWDRNKYEEKKNKKRRENEEKE